MSERPMEGGKMTLSAAEAADLLRRLAEGLEKGRFQVGGTGLSPEGELQVKVKGKSREGKSELALKIKWSAGDPKAVAGKARAGAGKAEMAAGNAETAARPRSADRPARPPEKKRPSYKNLKKRMGRVFKEIRRAVAEGQLPAGELVSTFEQDADLMMLFPRKGDAASLGAFLELTTAFVHAFRAGDREELSRAVAALKQSEKDCHHRFK